MIYILSSSAKCKPSAKQNIQTYQFVLLNSVYYLFMYQLDTHKPCREHDFQNLDKSYVDGQLSILTFNNKVHILRLKIYTVVERLT